MKNQINKLSDSLTLADKIAFYEKAIFDEQIWKDQEMRKIPEVTYSYTSFVPKLDSQTEEDYRNNKKKLRVAGKTITLNTTLFCSLGDLDLANFESLSDKEKTLSIINASSKLQSKIKNKTQLIQKAMQDIEKYRKNTDNISESESNLIDIFINSLKEKELLFEYCVNGLPYELQKAGIDIDVSDHERKAIDARQKEIDKIVFLGDIQDNPLEVEICYDYLVSAYKSKKEKLAQDGKTLFSEQEEKRYEYFLDKIRALLANDYSEKENKPLENYLEALKKVDVKDADYITGFNLSVESQGGLAHTVEKDENAKSISDGPKGVIFPTTEKFKNIKLNRFLLLNTHEIEVHSITDTNNEILIGNIRGVGSTMKDEGLAILMEKLLEHGNQLLKIDKKTGKQIIDIEKLPIKTTFPYILMGELLTNDELKEFLELNEKIEPDTIEIQSRFDRLKRSNSSDFMTQKKDTSYIRGLLKSAELINQYILSDGERGVSIEDLFLGKVGFDEVNKLKDIKESREKAGEKFDLVSTNFVSDAVLYTIMQKSKGDKVFYQGFLDYLTEKYPLFDFSKYKIGDILTKTKKTIVGVINMTEKSIDQYNSSHQGDTIDLRENRNNYSMVNNAKKSLTPERLEATKKHL